MNLSLRWGNLLGDFIAMGFEAQSESLSLSSSLLVEDINNTSPGLLLMISELSLLNPCSIFSSHAEIDLKHGQVTYL